MTKLALGTVQFGMDYGINSGIKVEQNEVLKIVNLARKSGIKLIDTAQLYGSSEKVLGNVNTVDFDIVTKSRAFEQDIINEFKIHPNNFALARAIVGDKSDNLEGVPGAGIKTVAKRFPFLVNTEEYDCETIVKNCHMSAKKLKLDYIINNFKPEYNKMTFLKMKFEDDVSHLNFDNLNRVLKNIKRS